jgi:hypothetical protein
MVMTFLVIALFFTWGIKRGAKRQNKAKPMTSVVWPGPEKNTSLPMPRLRESSGFLINGVPAQIDMITSKRTVAGEMAEYERKWGARGLRVIRSAFGPMHFISALDDAAKIFACAIMMKDPKSGATLVFPAELDMSRSPAPSKYKTPLYPACQPIFHIESNDLSGYSETITFLSDASIPSVMNFYHRSLAQAGWQEVSRESNLFSSAHAGNLLFLKGADELWIAARTLEDENKTLVYALFNDKF